MIGMSQAGPEMQSHMVLLHWLLPQQLPLLHLQHILLKKTGSCSENSRAKPLCRLNWFLQLSSTSLEPGAFVAMQTGLYQHPSTAATPLPVTPVWFLSQCTWILSLFSFCLQKHGCGALTESEKQTDRIGSGNPSPWVKPHSHGPLPQQNSPAVCQAHMV